MFWIGCALLVALALRPVQVTAQTLSLLNVPFLTQSEALCGGAAAAMVLRYWGAEGLTPESFAGLVDQSASGIRTEVLRADLVRRGWNALAVEGDDAVVARELDAGRPTIALIEDRPGTYHYVVVVGWHPRGVVLHDPARAPYRVMAVEEFQRRWRATNEWTLLVTPGDDRSTSAPAAAPPVSPAAATDVLSCDAAIARGIEQAQANALDAAERTLSGALACPGAAGLRELAGVRALQRRWPEVVELASSVVAANPGDSYGWQLLATGRFLTNDAEAALTAWNAIDQPAIDLFVVEGLRRVRQRQVEQLTALRRGDVLTVSHLVRATRQLAEWPAATATAVSYTPKPAGRADIKVIVSERTRLPHNLLALGVIGGRAVFTREFRIPLGPLTSEGDRVELGWRFWPDRPRYSAAMLTPAPWGGLWGVQVSSERQPLTAPVPLTFRRESASVVVSAWQTGRIRWQGGGGIDRWNSHGRFGTVNGGIDFVTLDDALGLRARGQTWLGGDGFTTWDVSLRAQRSLGGGRYVVDTRAATAYVSSSAPYDLWHGGDNGQARPTLLRAHPLVTRGRFRASRLGGQVTTASAELQRLFAVRGSRLGPAMFVDVGRTARTLVGVAPFIDTDVGIGLRARLPGRSGTVRIDIAKGLRDGASALSFVFEP